ncbi:MAG: hypothetical protein V4549_07280 [Bacteroidota bacterium]
MKVGTNNLNLHLARLFLPQKFSTETRILAEIMLMHKDGKEINSIHMYNTVPDFLHISKDAYRKAIGKLIKKGLVKRDKHCLLLNNDILKKEITELTIKQE